MLNKHLWKDQAACLNLDTNLYFDKYEEDQEIRHNVDSLCQQCPVIKTCFAVGVSNKEWGVWGGIYLEDGEISREFNRHKNSQNWSNAWISLTTETNK